jgi:hypothetical protein
MQVCHSSYPYDLQEIKGPTFLPEEQAKRDEGKKRL